MKGFALPSFQGRMLAMFCVCLMGLVGLSGSAAEAQTYGRTNNIETNSAYFFYAKPGQATIQVNVLGVRRSGLYEVPEGTNLNRLLSLSGGIGLQSRSEREKPQKVTIRLYRTKRPGSGPPTFEARYRKILKGVVETPVLQEGDVLMVDVVRPRRFTFSQGLSIVSTVASVALLIVRILDRR